jgi:hypothetical protein
MMKIFSDKLSQISTGWMVLLSLAVFIIFIVFVLPAQAAQADKVANEAGTPDLSLAYTTSDLYEMAEAYSEQGRTDYVRARFTFDLVWPLAYGVFLASAISWGFARATPAESIWRRANLAPVLGVVFDYLENISTSIVMIRYPLQTPVVDMLATVFTPVKWIFVGASFLLLLIGGGLTILTWNRNR